ncbi:hypothetical protein GCM10023096_16160 [Nonomuraea ferruginea]
MGVELSQVWRAMRTEPGEMITKGGRPRPRGKTGARLGHFTEPAIMPWTK